MLAALNGVDQRLGDLVPRRTVGSHVRRCTAQVGRINEVLDRAEADGVIDDRERAELRAELLRLASVATDGAEDLGTEGGR